MELKGVGNLIWRDGGGSCTWLGVEANRERSFKSNYELNAMIETIISSNIYLHFQRFGIESCLFQGDQADLYLSLVFIKH